MKVAGREAGFVKPPFGNCEKALTEYTWEAVVLEPFDRLLENKDEKTQKDAKEKNL